jgi:hypothetical protein
MDAIVGMLSLGLPLVVGAGMATLVYSGLTRMQPPREPGATVAPVDTRSKRSTGALTVCLMILGISGALGAMLGRLFSEGKGRNSLARLRAPWAASKSDCFSRCPRRSFCGSLAGGAASVPQLRHIVSSSARR